MTCFWVNVFDNSVALQFRALVEYWCLFVFAMNVGWTTIRRGSEIFLDWLVLGSLKTALAWSIVEIVGLQPPALTSVCIDLRCAGVVAPFICQLFRITVFSLVVVKIDCLSHGYFSNWLVLSFFYFPSLATIWNWKHACTVEVGWFVS